jgi:hypothetical protein
LVLEWHPRKNIPLCPKDVTPGSGKKVWWLCEKGHEWQAAIHSRSKGSGCPICKNGHRIHDDEPVMLDSTLRKEWHPTKNGDLNPLYVDSSYQEEVWWVCHEGYEWQDTIKSRLEGAGCTHCANIAEAKQKRKPTTKREIHSDNPIDLNPIQPSRFIPILGPAIKAEKGFRDFRKEKRFAFQDTLILGAQDSEQWNYARSVNISSAGLLIESEVPYNMNSNLLVKFTRPPFKSMQKNFQSTVRWCKELGAENIDSTYGIGVKFI